MACFIEAITIAIILALASGFLPAKGKPSSRIAGGVEVPLGSVPHQVVLTTEKYYFCSGSIIDRDFIITAGQCCVGIVPTGIVAGVNNLESPEDGVQEVQVSQVVPHPSYINGKHSNDICILHLKGALTLGNATRTATIKLPPAGYLASGYANVSGWGFTLDGSSSKLMSARVPILNDNDNVCQKYNGPNGSTIVESMLCAGDKGKGACLGDSGGPLVDSKPYLVGVLSRGNACSNTNHKGIYTEVSYFVHWIHETISQVRKAEKITRNLSLNVGSRVEHT